MHKYLFDVDATTKVKGLLRAIAAEYTTVEDHRLISQLPLWSDELPVSLKGHLNDFRCTEPSGCCVLSGYPVSDTALGKTPSHWTNKSNQQEVFEAELLLMLCATRLGDVFAWSTQQDGRIMHDILPIKGHEKEQLGSGSEELLTWHTEDAFHPYRGDYIGLMCLRNPDGVATTIAQPDLTALPGQLVEELFKPQFKIRPDESHLPKNQGNAAPPEAQLLVQAAYQRIESWNENPPLIPILSGDRSAPYLCLDPYFMDFEGINPTARTALQALIDLIDAQLEDSILVPGDICFLDNMKAVHGRKPFKARFDGTDRWLKRVNVTRNLRKSRDSRTTSQSRVLY